MGKNRYINTKFWDDNYIVCLDPIEKLLFLYFLTNPIANCCGIYEIPLRRVGFDTGIEPEMIKKILDRLSRDEKVFYFDGWIAIKNFIKNQKIENENSNLYKGIISGLKEIPSEIMLKIQEKYNPLKDIESRSTPLNAIELSKLKLLSKSKLKSKPKLNTRETPATQMREFITSPDKQNEVIRFLGEKGINRDLVAAEIKKFISYWSELNKSGTRQRWELQKTFEIKRRLATWFNNIQKFNKSNSRKVSIL